MTMIDTSQTVQRLETRAAAPMGDEIAMMDLDTGNYAVLNRVAAAIWEEIQEPVTVAELVGRMRARFDVPREQCEAEVLQFLGTLHEKGLVSIRNA